MVDCNITKKDGKVENGKVRNVQRPLHRVPGGQYTGEINFIASHLTSVLWQTTFSSNNLVVQETAGQFVKKRIFSEILNFVQVPVV